MRRDWDNHKKAEVFTSASLYLFLAVQVANAVPVLAVGLVQALEAVRVWADRDCAAA